MQSSHCKSRVGPIDALASLLSARARNRAWSAADPRPLFKRAGLRAKALRPALQVAVEQPCVEGNDPDEEQEDEEHPVPPAQAGRLMEVLLVEGLTAEELPAVLAHLPVEPETAAKVVALLDAEP